MMILEVQLTRDSDKRRTWPAYQAVLRAQYRCPAMVVVLAPHPAVARWCAEPIDMDGRGNSVMRPTVIGPSKVPVVTDPSEAVRTPAIAALSVIAHGHSVHALEVGRAGLHAARSLDEPDASLYADLIFHHLNAAARNALENEMDLKNYEYQSDFARKYIAKGEAAGEARGKADAVLLVLRTRGLAVDEALEGRVRAQDLEQLDGLLVRATSVDSADDLFEA